jgi:hypothetical protein
VLLLSLFVAVVVAAWFSVGLGIASGLRFSEWQDPPFFDRQACMLKEGRERGGEGGYVAPWT